MRMVFDIGGSSFRYALFDGNKMVARAKMATPNYLQGLTSQEINDRLLDLIDKALGPDRDMITDIGICYAGPVSGSGSILGSPTIHGEKLERPFDLKSAVAGRTGIGSVRVTNDLSAAAYRYLDDYRSYELITISTSIGNKIVIEGKLQLGSEGLEGEIGHISALLPPPYTEEVSIACSCGCGLNHLGALSSGRGIAEVATQLKSGSLRQSYETSPLKSCQNPSPEAISKAAEQGDHFSQTVIDLCTYPLAYAICLTLTSLYLEKVILIGGVILNSPGYFDSLLKNILGIGVYNYGPESLRQKITKGTPDDDSGLIGMNRLLQTGGE